MSEDWREQARAAEAPYLAELAAAALADATPAGVRLRGLACGAALFQPDPGQRARAVALVRQGLAGGDPDGQWDALHAAGELGLGEVAQALEPALASPRAPVRARAVEVLGQLDPQGGRATLERLKTADPDWTVRRLCADALRRPGQPAGDPRDPFSRYRALVRTGRVRQESSASRPDPRALIRQGVRLPAALRAFLLDVCPGGKVVLEGEGGGAGVNLALFSPLELAGRARQGATSAEGLKNLQDYVWQRYVEGSSKAPRVDEDKALREYGARYDKGLVDSEAWAYGVLLYESAFRDEANRADLLCRAREQLRAYRALSDEAWDVVDDRLADAEELVTREGLTPDPRREERLPFACLDQVVELAVDLLHPGVWATDPERGTWQVAPSLAAFLGDPRPLQDAAQPAASCAEGGSEEEPALAPGGGGALDRLAEAQEHLVQGRLRQAGRAFGDALESDRSARVLERASALLTRPELSPLQAAQLLAVVPMAGDKPSQEAVRAALAALPAERALAMVEAIGPEVEDGNQAALLVDAAAGIRKKSHAAVSEAARRLKKERGRAHLRTVRNPFYKS